MDRFADALLQWFDRFGRKDLPWQLNRTPYRVWVSEIMLQQTQVKTVIPYFERFMKRFPGINDLASATTNEVLHQWTGLGYYARARNLHKTAQRVMQEYNGELPMDPELLLQLPGIGASTANAIVAQCTGQRAVILDGNVKRVVARYFAIEGWPGQSSTARQLWDKADELTPSDRVTDYTQAIMDLGAMVCTRTRPACERCPVATGCEARLSGRIEHYPGRKPRKALPVRDTVMLCVQSRDAQILLQQRPPSGIWGGLWSLPECSIDEVEATLQELGIFDAAPVQLSTFRHSFTHYHLDITPLHIRIGEPVINIHDGDLWRWHDPAQPEELGLSKPAVQLMELLKDQS